MAKGTHEVRVAPYITRVVDAAGRSRGWRVYLRRDGVQRPKRFPPAATLAQLQRFIESFQAESARLRKQRRAQVKSRRLQRLCSGAVRRSDVLEKRWHLYVIASDRAAKIGRAIDPRQRLKELQTGHDQHLHLLAAVPCEIRVESAIHRRFAHIRTRGEWFVLTDELEGFIKHLQAGHAPESDD